MENNKKNDSPQNLPPFNDKVILNLLDKMIWEGIKKREIKRIKRELEEYQINRPIQKFLFGENFSPEYIKWWIQRYPIEKIQGWEGVIKYLNQKFNQMGRKEIKDRSTFWRWRKYKGLPVINDKNQIKSATTLLDLWLCREILKK